MSPSRHPRPPTGNLCGVGNRTGNRASEAPVELMPVHAFVDDRRLLEKGLRNYWGYNSIGFFAPDMRYSSSGRVNEFKSMVKRLHSAGIEVILDVVYNHSAEGNHLGPTLSFRGIDNTSYYRLLPDEPRYYMDFSGCGNTLPHTAGQGRAGRGHLRQGLIAVPSAGTADRAQPHRPHQRAGCLVKRGWGGS